jgi:hypothetical protein
MDGNTIRRRADASSSQSPIDEQSGPQHPPKTRQTHDEKRSTRTSSGGVGIMTVVRIVGSLALLSSAMSWFITGDSVTWGWKPWFFSMSAMESWLVRFQTILGIRWS